MVYKHLFIWVEGVDDQRFFERIVKPILNKIYDCVEIIEYAYMKNEKIVNFLNSIKSMHADYIFVTDINSSPCVTTKKRDLKNRIANIDEGKIIVVIKEIESWYLAGLDDMALKKCGFKKCNNTNDITKERFNDICQKKFGSHVDCMIELLKFFSLEVARQRNSSFSYFYQRYIRLFSNAG